jgi:hypothetical protein
MSVVCYYSENTNASPNLYKNMFLLFLYNYFYPLSSEDLENICNFVPCSVLMICNKYA